MAKWEERKLLLSPELDRELPASCSKQALLMLVILIKTSVQSTRV